MEMLAGLLPDWPEEAPQMEADRPENTVPLGPPGPCSGELGWSGPGGVSENRGWRHTAASAFFYLCSWSPRRNLQPLPKQTEQKEMSLKHQKEDLDNNNVVSGLGSNCCDNISSHLYRA